MNNISTNMQIGGGTSDPHAVGISHSDDRNAPSGPPQLGTYSQLALTSAYRLTKTALPNEETVRHELGLLLQYLDVECQFESKVPGGSVDIFLPNCNFVIEVKDQGHVGPDRDGSQPGETQLDQINRYIVGKSQIQHSRTPLMVGQSGSERWKGLLTDGRIYFFYKYLVTSNGELIQESHEVRSFMHAPPATLCAWLENRINDTNAKISLPTAPGEVAGIFQSFAPELRELYTDLLNRPATQTKQSLWLDMNRGSGFDVIGSETDLFVDHTLLTNAAEFVIASIDGAGQPGTEAVADGFASWPQARDQSNEPTSTAGADWTNQLFQTVCDYDWLGRDRDVLRDVYEAVIKPKHRKAFGEYYTPDWLAEVVVEEVLDESWCDRAVTAALESGDAPLRGIGVLDPACGSGTFLFHAARRIETSTAMARQHLGARHRARVIAKLVHGIDIHPVAVSIARATLIRAMPPEAGVTRDELNVFHGDSLAIRQSQGIRFVNENPLARHAEVISPKGTVIPVPLTLAGASDFNAQLRRIVGSAHMRQPLPDGIVNDLSGSDSDIIRHMHDAMTKVCEEEGNSVWV